MENFITITEPVFSNGKYFKPNEQYNFFNRVMIKPSCPLCKEDKKNVIQLHYRIIIDGKDYTIPEYAAVKSDKILSPINENIHNRIKHEKYTQEKDIRALYRKLLGRDVVEGQSPSVNVHKIVHELSFSTYGNVEDRGYRQTRPAPKTTIQFSGVENNEIVEVFNVVIPEIYYINIGDIVTLTPELTGYYRDLKFTWSTGETTETIEVSPTETTIYDLTIEDWQGCKYYLTTVVKVTNPLNP